MIAGGVGIHFTCIEEIRLFKVVCSVGSLCVVGSLSLKKAECAVYD